MTTNQTTDIRIDAWAFGRNAGSLTAAYTALENADERAVRVFAALRRNEWGVEAAFKSGVRGENIEARDPRNPTVTVAFTAGGVSSSPTFTTRTARRGVAANGGTI